MNFTLLPAWRWTFTTFHTQYGHFPGITEILTGIASVLFSLSAVIWTILLWIVKFATDTNFIKGAANVLNKVVATVFKTLEGGTSGQTHDLLIGAICVGIVTYAIWRAFFRGAGHILRTFVSCFIPLGLFFAIGTAAASSTTGAPAVMSPGWIATTINTKVNTIASWLPGQIAKIEPSRTAQVEPSCTAYVVGLDKKFTSSFATSSAAQIPVAVSQLWADSYLTAFDTAQFGTTKVGQRVGCRWLEMSHNVPASTQLTTQDLGSGNQPAAGATTKKIYGPFTPTQQPIAMVAWIDCGYAGGWKVLPPFTKVQSTGLKASACATWWAGWKGTTEKSTGPFGIAFNTQTKTTIAKQTKTAPEANTVYQAWNGNNGGNAMLDSIFSVGSAGAYGFALGGLALGTVLAQLMLIVVLCALPFLLLVMALPGEIASHMGRSLFKIGLGAAVAKIFFGLLLGFLIVLVTMFNTLFTQNTSGILEVLAVGLTPLLAFFALHFLLKKVGMSGLLSLKGAIATTAGIMGGAQAPGALMGRGNGGLPRSDRRLPSSRTSRRGPTGQRGIDPSRPGGARTPASGPRTVKGGAARVGSALGGATGKFGAAKAKVGQAAGTAAGTVGTATSKVGQAAGTAATAATSGAHMVLGHMQRSGGLQGRVARGVLKGSAWSSVASKRVAGKVAERAKTIGSGVAGAAQSVGGTIAGGARTAASSVAGAARTAISPIAWTAHASAEQARAAKEGVAQRLSMGKAWMVASGLESRTTHASYKDDIAARLKQRDQVKAVARARNSGRGPVRRLRTRWSGRGGRGAPPNPPKTHTGKKQP